MDSIVTSGFPLTGNLSVDGYQLHYQKFGEGRQLVIAFHGYGGEASMFHFLVHPDFTVISIELPFHGKSGGVHGMSLSKSGLAVLAEQLLQDYDVKETGLVGFSLGARACLSLFECIPNAVRNIVLIAPDGIRSNGWYRFLTGTVPGVQLFRNFAFKGNKYLSVFSFLHGFGLLNRYKYKFALQYIRTPESRKLLWDIWMSTRKLIPNMSVVKRNIHKRHTPVHIIMGQHDQVIPLGNALKFKGNSSNIQIHVFERGHNLLEYEEVKGTVSAWLFRNVKQARKA